jgi:leucyl-tRNA synthetase
VLRTRLRLLAPIVPFMTNELHERLEGEPVEDAAWPAPNDDLENERIEAEERLIEALRDDIQDIVDVTGEDPDVIQIFTAAPWKRRVFEHVVDVGPDVDAVMSEVMQVAEFRDRGERVNDLVGPLVEETRERSDEELEILTGIDEMALYELAVEFLGGEFDARVSVVPEMEADVEKAAQAEPFRPAVLLE